MEKEVKKGPGRPRKTTSTKPPKTETIKALKEQLAKAEEAAATNLEYAKQASKEADQAFELSQTTKEQVKGMVDTMSYVIDSFENLIRLLRKAIELDLTKKHVPERREPNER